VLIRQENNSRRGSINSQNDSFSILSDASRESSTNKVEVIKYKSVQEWMEKEAPKRLKEAFRKLGLEETLMRGNRKAELEQYIEGLTVDGLANEKKKVKNELKNYDNDFNNNFKKMPNHEEKEPLRPLYVYYKKLK
jgi:molecular chaperone DnaK (HSP70)